MLKIKNIRFFFFGKFKIDGNFRIIVEEKCFFLIRLTIIYKELIIKMIYI